MSSQWAQQPQQPQPQQIRQRKGGGADEHATTRSSGVGSSPPPPGCCRRVLTSLAVMLLLLLGFLALLSVPAEQPEGQQSAPASAASAAPAVGGLPKPQKPWSALVLGGSGATGRVLVAKLASNPRVTRIGALVRTELPLDYWGPLLPANAAKIQQTVVDFEKLDESAEAFKGYDAGFSTLGSTRSKAGSKEQFYHIDFDYITHAAKLAKEAGVQHFNLMSTTGADAKSSFHYLRTKGQIEEYIKSTVQFPSFASFRPGVLLTERSESRWGEWFAQKILPVLHPILPEKHCAVYTQTVAEAMMQHTEFIFAQHEAQAAERLGLAAAEAAPKERTFENDEIRALKVGRE